MVPHRLSNEVWKLTNPGGDYTNNGYPSRIATTTAPPLNATSGSGLQATGDGVIPFGQDGAEADGWLHLVPIGSGTGTFSLTILGWRQTKLGVGVPLWFPCPLAAYNVTLGTMAGVVNSDLPTTEVFGQSDTITLGPTLVNSAAPNTVPPIVEGWCSVSPGSNAACFISTPSFGFRYLEVIFTTGGSATSCNALYVKG
jgi:hypothetical protein